ASQQDGQHQGLQVLHKYSIFGRHPSYTPAREKAFTFSRAIKDFLAAKTATRPGRKHARRCDTHNGAAPTPCPHVADGPNARAPTPNVRATPSTRQSI